MKLRELISETRHSGRDAYERDYDSSVSGMGRGDDHRGLSQELAHETNNIAIAINGKTWKVVPGKGYADSKEEWAYLNNMKNWAEKKSASSGKKWSVHLTGAPVTISETATAGATTSANVGTVISPQVKLGKARGKKSYTGSPSTGSGTKAPPQPKVIQPKNSDGTAKNGLDMKGANLFGAPIKR
jgi:hypothetical protein